jgi:hypothetical protein
MDPPPLHVHLCSTLFENPCVAVVGASGCIFGLLGAFLADIIINFEQISRYCMGKGVPADEHTHAELSLSTVLCTQPSHNPPPPRGPPRPPPPPHAAGH